MICDLEWEGVQFVYRQGDQVVYGIHGVCRIHEISKQLVNRKRVEYYVLVPLNQPDARFFVPTQNQAAASKMRPILTKQEIAALLILDAMEDDCWIDDENQRKQYYRELIVSGDRAKLICMIRSLYIHKENQIKQGRKFHLCDENFLRDAEKLLSSEFAFVLGITQNEVSKYIQDRLC